MLSRWAAAWWRKRWTYEPPLRRSRQCGVAVARPAAPSAPRPSPLVLPSLVPSLLQLVGDSSQRRPDLLEPLDDLSQHRVVLVCHHSLLSVSRPQRIPHPLLKGRPHVRRSGGPPVETPLPVLAEGAGLVVSALHLHLRYSLDPFCFRQLRQPKVTLRQPHRTLMPHRQLQALRGDEDPVVPGVPDAALLEADPVLLTDLLRLVLLGDLDDAQNDALQALPLGLADPELAEKLRADLGLVGPPVGHLLRRLPVQVPLAPTGKFLHPGIQPGRDPDRPPILQPSQLRGHRTLDDGTNQLEWELPRYVP